VCVCVCVCVRARWITTHDGRTLTGYLLRALKIATARAEASLSWCLDVCRLILGSTTPAFCESRKAAPRRLPSTPPVPIALRQSPSPISIKRTPVLPLTISSSTSGSVKFRETGFVFFAFRQVKSKPKVEITERID